MTAFVVFLEKFKVRIPLVYSKKQHVKVFLVKILLNKKCFYLNEIYRQFKNIRQLFIKYNFRPKPKRWRKSNDLGFSPVEVSREVGGSSLERFFRGDLNGSHNSFELGLSLYIWPPCSCVQRIVVPLRRQEAIRLNYLFTSFSKHFQICLFLIQ